jgi:hypothetical protein
VERAFGGVSHGPPEKKMGIKVGKLILTIIYGLNQCCGSETFHYGSGSGSDFPKSSGSGSYFQKVPVSDPTFFLAKYDFKGPKMAFQNIIF